MSEQQSTVDQVKFYSSKQLVETYAAKRVVEVFFGADSIKKTDRSRREQSWRETGGQTTSPYGGGGWQQSYVKPIIIRVDGERHDDIDFNFNLNGSTVETIKRHPTKEFWVISIDATIVKQFIDKEGISHDFYPSETMYVMNAKTINKLKDLERTKQSVNAFEGEL